MQAFPQRLLPLTCVCTEVPGVRPKGLAWEGEPDPLSPSPCHLPLASHLAVLSQAHQHLATAELPSVPLPPQGLCTTCLCCLAALPFHLTRSTPSPHSGFSSNVPSVERSPRQAVLEKFPSFPITGVRLVHFVTLPPGVSCLLINLLCMPIAPQDHKAHHSRSFLVQITAVCTKQRNI